MAFRQVSDVPSPDRKCSSCSHDLRRHQAQEGMCLDCKCFGWEPSK